MAILVNGERIGDERIRAEAMRLREHGGGQVSEEEATGRAKEMLVGEVLLHQHARERDAPVSDAEVNAEIERAVLGFGGREAFCRRFGFNGLEDERLRSQAEENVRVGNIVREHAGAIPEPTEEEARAFFEEHRDAYRLPERIRASHIIRRPRNDGPGPQEGDPEVYAEMQAARRRLREGASFAEEAERLTECTDNTCGDLGLIQRGQMVEAFDAVVWSLEDGEVSPVFMTRFGYHIATVTGREPARDRTFEEVRDNVLGRLRAEREGAARRAAVEALKTSAAVEEVEEDAPAASGQGFGPRGKGKSKSKGKQKGKKGKK